MPLYDFKCEECGHVDERFVRGARVTRVSVLHGANCKGALVRQYPTSFNALNTTRPAGMGVKLGLGVECYSTSELTRVMKEQGCRPSEEYRYHRGAPERKEISEKELGEVLRECNDVGSI